MSGFLLINKPTGITSHDVVDRLRAVTGEKRIGHSGTLDPFATGLLIVGVGRDATKRLGELQKLPKTYRATLMLGATSDTGDRTGTITVRHPGPNQDPIGFWPSPATAGSRPGGDQNDVTAALKKFTGDLQQTPPMYSAKKIAGKKLYELAREGKTVERQPITISITRLELLRYEWPKLEIEVDCSSGTYIRTLGEDIGKALGCSAYVDVLERLTIGQYRLQDAVELSKMNTENWKEQLFYI